MTTYRIKPQLVEAVLWTGNNRDEVKKFFAEWMPQDAGLRFSRDENPDCPYNDLLFTAFGDDQEVSPGFAVIVNVDGPVDDDDEGGAVMRTSEFLLVFEEDEDDEPAS